MFFSKIPTDTVWGGQAVWRRGRFRKVDDGDRLQKRMVSE
jgi:hypothetical protein